jgi:hypothetical protein
MYYIPQLCQLLPVLNKLLQPLWDDRSQQSDESPAILAMCTEVFVCPPQTSFPSNLGNVYGRRYAGRGAPLVPPRSAPAPSSEHRVATPSPAWQRRSPHNQATNLLITLHRIPGDGARGSSLDVGERESDAAYVMCACAPPYVREERQPAAWGWTPRRRRGSRAVAIEVPRCRVGYAMPDLPVVPRAPAAGRRVPPCGAVSPSPGSGS